MTKRPYPIRVAAIALAVTLLAGCKIMDGELNSGFTGQGSVRSGGRTANSAPTIWGDPQRSALVGASYAFRPEAEDADGDMLEFSIENKPDWASFDATTGLMQGVPGPAHAGAAGNIVISVKDRDSVVSLPSFDITVRSAPAPEGEDDAPASSAPPTISGTPNTAIVVGSTYVFRPETSDPDGDTLSFSVVNKPVWASFSTTTGRLDGTPDGSHVGTGNPIEISVTDGVSIAALPRFSITVEPAGTVSKTIQWTPPTENEDGTPLTNLAGYRIYYGTASGEYSETIELYSAGLTSYTIQGLVPGTYYLAMTSFTSDDVESRRTPEMRFEL